MRPVLHYLPALLMSVVCCQAWDSAPHRTITKAALDTLPPSLRARLGNEAANLVEIYCMLPDRYTEMERFGFTRNSPGPHEPSEIRAYCVRPDGKAVHSAVWEREEDLASLVYLFERILSSLGENRQADAAKYMGTLSHFIADSLSPPHTSSRDLLRAMAKAPKQPEDLDLHRAIEQSLPDFNLEQRAQRAMGNGIMGTAQTVVDRCYAAAEKNRNDLPSMVKAVYAGDQRTLDVYRLRAGKAAAEILADTLYTLLVLSNQ